ncbi:hypothetical protein [Nostocoides sp. HKS02]|uniref:hypothetical protein n=1 Tax=Nostocoides sp. HKS02 TaxID=1813880 RepID=UPI0012B4521D|nr:hypothetical protein [Tetrasphaera sp. HKS02]QGN56725.1 hypothetical protein GKE56_01090 [Tetrasphaera sp. HKS02]
MTKRVLLVVADPGDVGGRAAARAAARHPRAAGQAARDVVVVSGDELACAGWSHRVDAAGVARTSVRLAGPDPRVLTDDTLAAVWFRSQQWLVPPGLRTADAGDVAYAHAELTALLVSWLSSLGPRAVNACEGVSPTGPGWSPARWRQVAADCLLPVAGANASTVRTVLVAGDEVVGAGDPAEARACTRLAAAGSCRVLEVGLDAGDRVSDVSTVPLLHDDARIRAAGAMLVGVGA